jgi:diguanylate cyclase (GGDEF)-like protein
MIDFLRADLYASMSVLDPPVNPSVGGLPFWDTRVEASKTVRELLNILDKNSKIPGALVLEREKLIGLITREEMYEKLGRPFGVELFLKNSVRQFYESLERKTLVMDSDTPIGDAVALALRRDARSLYAPFVVLHAEGYRIVTMYSLLIAQQDALRSLYSEVHHLSTKDPLTLVNNRRGFFEIVNRHLETVRLLGAQYAVLMIDMDNFKNVNDRYGHLVGDEVIKSVAQRISAKLREGDVLGRFGGEEFVVFLMNTSQSEAFDFAEGLRQDLASFFHVINWFQIRVTVSIGISHAEGASRVFDRVLTEADQALYVAKNKGRNKTAVWDESMTPLSSGQKNFRATAGESSNFAENLSTQTLQGFLRMLYLRDYETEAHTARVCEMTLRLAKRHGFAAEDLEGIGVRVGDAGDPRPESPRVDAEDENPRAIVGVIAVQKLLHVPLHPGVPVRVHDPDIIRQGARQREVSVKTEGPLCKCGRTFHVKTHLAANTITYSFTTRLARGTEVTEIKLPQIHIHIHEKDSCV